MDSFLLTSLQNPRIKAAVRLRERRERDATGTFLVEGYRELTRALSAFWPIETLFFCEELFLGENEAALLQKIQQQGGKLWSCTRAVFEKISYRDRPDGLLGIAKQQPHSLSFLEQRQAHALPPFLVVAEAIEKPGNLGTILRSADAVGVDGVILADQCTDLYNPNVVRASTGILFSLPVIAASTEETLLWLQKHNIRILATTPSATLEYTDADLTEPLAVVVGTEQLGLSSTWLEAADLKVRLPMQGVADSLNVATATTVLLYEALRQRRLRYG